METGSTGIIEDPDTNLDLESATETAFEVGAFVVYPAHGVGRIVEIEMQPVGSDVVRVYRISFDQERMELRVPVGRAEATGLRRVLSQLEMARALTTLSGRVRVRRTMWTRRAQEYGAKINSGNAVYIAEVVRDLFRGKNQPDQSYSERQLYRAALGRLAREFAILEEIDEDQAVGRLESILSEAA